MSPGFAYTVGSGKLYCPFAEFRSEAEELLGRPILTHEFAASETWDELRAALEYRLSEGSRA